MDYTYEDIAKMIDHSLLNPTLTAEQLEAGCAEALKYDVASVCIMPFALSRCREAAACRRAGNDLLTLDVDVLVPAALVLVWFGLSKGIVPLKGVAGKLASRPSVAGMSLPAPVTVGHSMPGLLHRPPPCAT